MRRGRGRGSNDDPMQVESEMGGGPGPGGPGGNKRRAASDGRPEVTVYSRGPPPPPGPHGAMVPELLPVHARLLEGMRDLWQQNQMLAHGAMVLEQQRQAAEAARAVREAEHREQMANMFRESLGMVNETARSAAAMAQRAHESAQSSSQQLMLQLQDAKRQERPMVNVVIQGGPPPPPPPPGTAPIEAVPAAAPNRMQLVPVVNPQTKRAQSSGEEVMAKRRPAEALAQREPKAVARLAIAAAQGATTGPEHPEEVPSSSAAGPEYKRPEQVAPYAAASGAAPSNAVRRLKAAGFDVDPGARGRGVNAGAALAADTSGSRPTPPMGERAMSTTGRFFGGKAHRLTSYPPTRRQTTKTPVERGRSRSRAAKV